MDRQKIREIYQGLKQEQEQELSELKKKHLLVSLLRLLVFIGGAVLSVLTFNHSLIAGTAVLFSAIVLFLFLIRIFGDLTSEITIAENLIRINGNEIRALDGDFSPFNGGADFIDLGHDFSVDIDLFGNSSLFSYLNRTVTVRVETCCVAARSI